MTPPRFDYQKFFREQLSSLPVGAKVAYRELMGSEELPTVSEATKKRHLRDFIEQNPQYLRAITGFYPKPETIIDLVELELGPVTELNLDEANIRCSRIVNELTAPMVQSFIREGLSGFIDAASQRISIELDEITAFLIEDFSDFMRSAGNGLVSIAGQLNEKLLFRAMGNAGMKAGHDFTKTGTDSEADLIIHSHAGTKENLSVEVKSYHARERLLRGLQDIREPKIGVGFFKDKSEFNPGRTETLLQAGPAAIYMPKNTLSQLHPDSLRITTNAKAAFGSRLYRPIEQFVSDMKGFNASGALPRYE